MPAATWLARPRRIWSSRAVTQASRSGLPSAWNASAALQRDLDDVEDIQDDREGDLPLARELLEERQLRLVAIHHGHPRLGAPRVPRLGLPERLREDRLGRV